MSTLIEHAERELANVGMDRESNPVGEYICKLVEVLESQEHSGGEAGMVMQTFMTVSGFGLLSPLTGGDDEWSDPDLYGERFNIRAPNVIKRMDGLSYDTQAKIYVNAAGIVTPREDSTRFIPEFPYMPEPQIITVGEKH